MERAHAPYLRLGGLLALLATAAFAHFAVTGGCFRQCLRVEPQLQGLGDAIEFYVATHEAPMPELGWFPLLGLGHEEFDPWAAPFVYTPGPELMRFDLRSKGADGVLGTEDDVVYRDLEGHKNCKSISEWTVLYRRYKRRVSELF